jgi:ABC-2 type transport system permease protein
MAITFGISAFLKRGGLGIGIGIGFGLYFMSILANLTDELEFLKYLTPFGFADSGHIISEGGLEPISLTVGIIFSVAGIALAYYQYNKKDIA